MVCLPSTMGPDSRLPKNTVIRWKDSVFNTFPQKHEPKSPAGGFPGSWTSTLKTQSVFSVHKASDDSDQGLLKDPGPESACGTERTGRFAALGDGGWVGGQECSSAQTPFLHRVGMQLAVTNVLWFFLV